MGGLLPFPAGKPPPGRIASASTSRNSPRATALASPSVMARGAPTLKPVGFTRKEVALTSPFFPSACRFRTVAVECITPALPFSNCGGPEGVSEERFAPEGPLFSVRSMRGAVERVAPAVSLYVRPRRVVLEQVVPAPTVPTGRPLLVVWALGPPSPLPSILRFLLVHGGVHLASGPRDLVGQPCLATEVAFHLVLRDSVEETRNINLYLPTSPAPPIPKLFGLGLCQSQTVVVKPVVTLATLYHDPEIIRPFTVTESGLYSFKEGHFPVFEPLWQRAVGADLYEVMVHPLLKIIPNENIKIVG